MAISKDDAFHILQNARRRAVLRHLLERSDTEQFQMREVAEAVAAWENDTTTERLTTEQRQRVYIALYQSHLPKLDNHGVIRYDQARGLVEPTPLLAVFGPFLESGLDADTQCLSIEIAGMDRDTGQDAGTEKDPRTQQDAEADQDTEADQDVGGGGDGNGGNESSPEGFVDAISRFFSP